MEDEEIIDLIHDVASSAFDNSEYSRGWKEGLKTLKEQIEIGERRYTVKRFDREVSQ